jgi:conjugal transfer pilus assembly protein TraK
MFRISIFLLMLLAFACQAQQKVPVQEGIEVTIKVSSQALNRIAVENDQITLVKGVSGQFELDKDTELGQVFLKPLSTDKHELIHLFVMTKNGHTYPLSLQVEEDAAQSILLMPLSESVAKWEQSSPYETLLKTLVQAMHNQTPLEGFLMENLKTSQSLPKIKQAKVTQLQTYRGNKLQGQILEIFNTSKEDLSLTEQEFYQKGVRAVAILNPLLLPKGKTRVYVLR